MEKKTWKDEIHPRTLLEGGIDWWNGSVTEITRSEDEISALVVGRRSRQVTLKIQDGQVTDSSCTCGAPSPCRHVAALRLCLEENDLAEEREQRIQRDRQNAEQTFQEREERYREEEAMYQEAATRAREEGERRAAEMQAMADRQGVTLSKTQLDGARSVPVGMERPVAPEMKYPPEPARLRSVVTSLTDEELRASMAELAMENEEVREWLALRVKKEVPSAQVEKWQRQVAKTVSETMEIGSQDRERGRNRMRALRARISDIVDRLLKGGQTMEAFQIVCTVWITMTGNRDYQEKGVPGLIDTCRAEWLQIVEAASREEKERMFLWFSGGWDNTGQMERILSDGAWEENQLQEMLTKLEKQLAESRTKLTMEELLVQADEEHRGVPLKPGSDPIWLVPEILSILEQLGRNGRILELCQEYHLLPMVRRWEIQWTLRNRDYSRAVVLLEESLKLDEGRPGLQRLHAERLARVYTILNQKDRCREMYHFLVFSCENWNTSAARHLKELTPPEEWEEEFQQILKLPGWVNLRVPLLKEEKRYDLLCSVLEESGTMEELESCEEELLAWNQDRYRDLYRTVLDRIAEETKGTSEYPGLVRRLLKLRAMPGGRSLARELANSWYKLYTRRAGLINELTKQGF